jgi:hypothetical protein
MRNTSTYLGSLLEVVELRHIYTGSLLSRLLEKGRLLGIDHVMALFAQASVAELLCLLEGATL